jgi:alanine-glyoxylate transaminase/serine-glyoxylate transaminase/serine-pyruvate transaminase
LSAIYYPEGIDGGKLLKDIATKNVIMAGGLHPEIKPLYFRVGHMGSVNSNDILACLAALEYGLKQQDFKFESGKSVNVFQEAYTA